MLNRRSRFARRRKSGRISFSPPAELSEPTSAERRHKKQDRRVDSIQAAFVNMQK
jgi:hypothetical protein